MALRPNFRARAPSLDRVLDPSSQFVVRERVIETGECTIAVPSIATVMVHAERKLEPRLPFWAAAFVCAAAGAINWVLVLLPPAMPIWIATLLIATILMLAGLRSHRSFKLGITCNDGSRFWVATDSRDQLDEIRAFLAEKINRQDSSARRVFRLDGSISMDAVAEGPTLEVDDALRLIAERARESTQPVYFDAPVALPILPNREVDYSTVLQPITDLHRYYERHPTAGQIRDMLSELELLMRSGTPSRTQRARVRELSLDLASSLAAYAPMTNLFQRIAQMVPAH